MNENLLMFSDLFRLSVFIKATFQLFFYSRSPFILTLKH